MPILCGFARWWLGVSGAHLTFDILARDVLWRGRCENLGGELIDNRRSFCQPLTDGASTGPGSVPIQAPTVFGQREPNRPLLVAREARIAGRIEMRLGRSRGDLPSLTAATFRCGSTWQVPSSSHDPEMCLQRDYEGHPGTMFAVHAHGPQETIPGAGAGGCFGVRAHPALAGIVLMGAKLQSLAVGKTATLP